MADDVNSDRSLDNDGLPRLPAYEPFTGDSVPGLARIAALAAWHTGQWGVKTTVRNWARWAGGKRTAGKPRFGPRLRAMWACQARWASR